METVGMSARQSMQIYQADDGTWHPHREAPSRRWERLRNSGDRTPDGAEIWENRWYDVTVRRYAKGFFVKNSPYYILGISNVDNSARHDWRDFQHIKNDLAGKDWEAVELYPAESRLKDPSNQFYLWCVPKGVLKFGLPGKRNVQGPETARAPQRPFPPVELA